MTQFIIYETQPNDRWDKIALKFYGNVYKQKELIEANPHIPIKAILDEGIKVKVPVIDTEVETDSDLPIWKQ